MPIASDRLLLGDGVGLPTHPRLYDRFLITVGLVFNALTVWTAWGWETS